MPCSRLICDIGISSIDQVDYCQPLALSPTDILAVHALIVTYLNHKVPVNRVHTEALD
jgi:hypothetical protein